MADLNSKAFISLPESLSQVSKIPVERTSCSRCQNECMASCERGGESCGSCESTNQTCGRCEDACMSSCEHESQHSCGSCENECMTTCEWYDETCGSCEDGCQSACEGSSQGCHTSCELSSQGCQTSCEISSQGPTEDPSWRVSADTDSVTIRVTDDNDWDYFSYSLRDSSGSTYYEDPTNYSTSHSHTIRGLDSGTQYRAYLSWSTSATGMGNYDYKYITTEEISVEPWSWYSSNGDASYSQTVAARDAVANKTSTKDFHYLVWNDLVNKTLEAIHADNEYWDTKYASIEETRMSSFSHTLTAKRFNSLRWNIGTRVSTGINEVSKDDTVYGWYFTTLATKLNDYIDNL